MPLIEGDLAPLQEDSWISGLPQNRPKYHRTRHKHSIFHLERTSPMQRVAEPFDWSAHYLPLIEGDLAPLLRGRKGREVDTGMMDEDKEKEGS